MTPSLRHLVEDHLKPKWWQFFRKQKYHVCFEYGNMIIYAIPTKCIVSGKLHNPTGCAGIEGDKVLTRCHCHQPILASDPAFFQKLDEYLEQGCYYEDRRPKDKYVSMPASSSMPGPSI